MKISVTHADYIPTNKLILCCSQSFPFIQGDKDTPVFFFYSEEALDTVINKQCLLIQSYGHSHILINNRIKFPIVAPKARGSVLSREQLAAHSDLSPEVSLISSCKNCTCNLIVHYANSSLKLKVSI